MKRCAPLVAIFSLTLGGCMLKSDGSPRDASAFADNSAAFDSYVSKRTGDLVRMGATKNASEAAFQARLEAERRYGPRTSPNSVSWSRSTSRTSRSLSSAEVDKALGK